MAQNGGLADVGSGRGGTRGTGHTGEQIALRHLKRLGFEVLALNYRFGRGEIDIIARDGRTLVFCEVKMRKTDSYGAPEYAVPPGKRRQIRRVAQGYLYERSITDQECRFDAVLIRWQEGRPLVDHIKNAF